MGRVHSSADGNLAPSLREDGVYTITNNPPKDTTVVSMRAYLLIRDCSHDYTAVYFLEKKEALIFRLSPVKLSPKVIKA